MSGKQSALHNKIAGEIVKSIINPVAESGGNIGDVMILTESVLVGVALACIRFGGDEAVLELMFTRAAKRLADIRLSGIQADGSA